MVEATVRAISHGDWAQTPQNTMERSTKKPSPLRLADPPSSSLSQRRESLPASRSAAITKRPSTEHGPAQPASPQVISSLISSLSAISTPAQSHFDSLPKVEPRTAPNSPGLRQTEFVRDDTPQQPPTSPGFGMDYGAYRSPIDDSEQDLLHPDAAAISPVVRMAKPPPPPRSPRSPRSPLSGPSSRSLPDDSAIPRTGSRASLASSTAGGQDEPSGFGVVSLEPGPRMSMASITSTGSAGKKSSLKSPLGLLKRSSRDFGKEKSGDHNEGRRLDSSRSGVSLRSNHSMADLAEEEVGTTTNDVQFLETTSFPNSSPALNGRVQSTPDTQNFSPGGIGSGRVIPTRESSLRHNHKRASSSRRRSVRHSTYSSRDFTVEDEITEDNVEEDGVSKRISELKHQQKKIRDELLQDNTADTSLKSRPQTPSRQRGTTNPPTPPQSAEAHQQERSEATQKGVDDIEESAPSPTVLTRRALSNNSKRNYSPLQPKQPNVQPSLERTDSSSLKGAKRPANASRTPESRNHRRKLSGQPSQAPRASPVPDERPSSADSIDHAVEDYLSAPRLTQKVSHPATNRVIAFSEVGDPKGHVVFCCVGMGLTRFLTAFYDELARTLKLRLITPDRPGVGESEPCADGTPLSWPDDLAIICNHLKITKFSLLAHSAGAIYALATALRMPQHIRARIHLLAPWIPPSQMTGMGSHKEPLPSNALPYSQRLLRALPTPFLKVANSSFMSATSSSITSSLPKSTRKTKRRSTVAARDAPTSTENALSNGQSPEKRSAAMRRNSMDHPSHPVVSRAAADPTNPKAESAVVAAAAAQDDRERESDYDNRLTHGIWQLATTNANPAVDLLICLERRQSIGFRYVDIIRSVVIHHGSRDTRVPVDNVRWLSKTMRRCEARILDGEGHGLMASAAVMGNVLMEIAKEWDDWTTVVQGRGRRGTTAQR